MFFCGGGDDGSVLFEDSLLRPRAGAIQRFFPLLWQVCVYWHAAVSVSESAEKNILYYQRCQQSCFQRGVLKTGFRLFWGGNGQWTLGGTEVRQEVKSTETPTDQINRPHVILKWP